MPWAIKIAGAAVELFSLDFLPNYMCLPIFLNSSEKGCVRAHRTAAKTTALFSPQFFERIFMFMSSSILLATLFLCPSIGKIYPSMHEQGSPFFNLTSHNQSYKVCKVALFFTVGASPIFLCRKYTVFSISSLISGSPQVTRVSKPPSEGDISRQLNEE